MEEQKNDQDLAFIKEKVKERPLNRRKLVRRTLLTAAMAVVFGLIACVTFLVLEPVFSNLLYPEEEMEQVQLKEENISEEMLPEDMLLEETESETEQQSQTVVERVELEMSDLQRLYRNMYALAQKQTAQSLVTVTGVTSAVDWFDNIYENNGQTAGLIIADNGKELLILADSTMIDGADQLRVTFEDGVQASAAIKETDQETGLSIVSVPLEEIEEATKGKLVPAVLGGSGSTLVGTPVIAIGRPLGSAKSVMYGMISSTDTYAGLVDGNVRILTTDMVGNGSGSGVLINLSGQVVGIIRPSGKTTEENKYLLTAYGISDIRQIIDKLMNGQEIAHLGILGMDVPREAQTDGVPQGAYVTGIDMDSPAMEAGIQSGDVIVKVGTVEIKNFQDYQTAVLSLAPDTGITVTVMRQGPDGYQEITADMIVGR